jgi:predicted ATPase
MAKYVREISLTNVRQFGHRIFPFQPGFNLLVGENGAGKTTLLRSLLTVLSTPKHKALRHALTDEDVRLHSYDLRVEAKIANEHGEELASSVYQHGLGSREKSKPNTSAPMVLWYGSNEAACSSFVPHKIRPLPAREKPKIMEEERWLYRMRRRFYREERFYREGKSETNFGYSEDVEIFVGRILGSFSERFREFHWSFEPYHCSILIPQKSGTETQLLRKTKRSLEYAILRRLLETEPNHKQPWPNRARVTINSRGDIIDNKNKFDELRHVYLDFKELLHNLKIGSIDLSLFDDCKIKIHLTPRIRVFDGPNGSFLLTQLSDGEQRLFSLFVDIARQLSLESDGPGFLDKSSAVVLIDEIDVHLHPKWQRMIVPALEELFPTCQFIATTHSPFVVQTVQENNVQHLNRNISGEQFTDRGIEEIAIKVMGVLNPLVSPRYLKMLDTARDYFLLLEEMRAMKSSPNAKSGELKELKSRLDGLSQKYAQNPAFQAYLELHGLLTLGPDELR